MFAGFGSTWGDNFYMGVETRNLILGNYFDSHLRIKVTALRSYPYVCIGSHAFAMFSAHALREGRGHARTLT